MSLTCDQLPDGEVATISVYHLCNKKYSHVRSLKLLGNMKNKDGSPIKEFIFGGEYPYELEAMSKRGHPTKRSFDANGKPKYRYLKPDEIKVEIDAMIDFSAEVEIEVLESWQIRGRLPGVPTRAILPDGSFRL